jgi:hypothetical protein
MSSDGYEVHRMVSMRDSNVAMRFDRSKDMSVHVLRFRCINTSYVEYVALIRRVSTSRRINELSVFRAMKQH